jgi:hypothetical protein
MPMQILYVQALQQPRALSVPTHPHIQNALNTPTVPLPPVIYIPK